MSASDPSPSPGSAPTKRVKRTAATASPDEEGGAAPGPAPFPALEIRPRKEPRITNPPVVDRDAFMAAAEAKPWVVHHASSASGGGPMLAGRPGEPLPRDRIARDAKDVRRTAAAVVDKLMEHGCAVLWNACSDECVDEMNDLMDAAFRRLFGGTVDEVHEQCLPLQTRNGLFQCLVANTPGHSWIRAHPSMELFFRAMYGEIHGKPGDPRGRLFNGPICASGDGVNVVPRDFFERAGPPVVCGGGGGGGSGGGGEGEGEDREESKEEAKASQIPGPPPDGWGHVDQAHNRDPSLWKNRWGIGRDTCEFVQTAVSFRDTSAATRASPGSHKIHADVVRALGKDPETVSRAGSVQFLKPKRGSEVKKKIAEMIRAVPGGIFQVPLAGRAGSMALWLSTTFHAAVNPYVRLVSPSPDPRAQRRLNGRFVFYASMRDATDFKKGVQSKSRRGSLLENRTTTHRGTTKFGKFPGPKGFAKKKNHTERARALMIDPHLVYGLVSPIPAGWEEEDVARFERLAMCKQGDLRKAIGAARADLARRVARAAELGTIPGTTPVPVPPACAVTE